MGTYDSIIVNCPNCGKQHLFQSKGGECLLRVFALEDCPDDVMSNVNRHSPYECSCGVLIEVDRNYRKTVIVKP
jgi:hypothetical protein